MRRLLPLILLLLIGCGGRSRPKAVGHGTAAVEDDSIPDDGSRLVVAAGHHGEIAALVATPDGRFVATLAADRFVRVYQTDGLRLRARLHLAGVAPRDLALSSDGARVAVAYADATIVYDVAAATPAGTIDGAVELPGCMVFDGDALLLWRGGLVRWDGKQSTRISTSTAMCAGLGLVGGKTLVLYDGVQLQAGELAGASWTPTIGPAVSTSQVVFGRGAVAWVSADDDAVWIWRADGAPESILAAAGWGPLAFVDDGAALLHVGFDQVTRVDVATRAITTSPLDDAPMLVASVGPGQVAIAGDNMMKYLCVADAKLAARTCELSKTGPVRSLLPTADGQLLVGADEAALRAWSLGFPTALRRYHYETWAPRSGAVVLSPDGKRTAQVGMDGVVIRPLAGTVQRPLEHQPNASYEGVAWSPDGAWLATTTRRDVIRMRADGTSHTVITDAIPQLGFSAWMAAHGEPDARATRAPRWLAYRPDGEVLAVGADDHVLLIRGDQITATLVGSDQAPAVTALAFRPGTNELAVGFADGVVRSWDTEAPATTLRERDLEAPIATLAFDAAGASLLVAVDGGAVVRFAAEDTRGETVVTAPHTALALALLPGGRIATGHLDGAVRIFRLASGEQTAELHALGSYASGWEDWLVIGADGRFESSLIGDGLGFYWIRDGVVRPFAEAAAQRRRVGVLEAALLDEAARPVRGAPGPEVVPQTWTQDTLTALTFTPDGRELLGRAEGGVYAFDVASGLLRGRIADGCCGTGIVVSKDALLRLGKSGLEALDRRTGRSIATTGGWGGGEFVGGIGDGEVILLAYDRLEVYTESPLELVRSAQVDATGAYGRHAALSGDGRRFAFTPGDGVAHLVATDTLTETATIRCAADVAFGIALDATGTWVACATGRGSIVVSRTDGSKTFVVRPNPFGSMQIVYDLVFHPTQSRLAVATLSGAYVYDLANAGAELRLEGPEQRHDTIAWSPDGATLATSALGGVISLHEAETGTRLHTYDPTRVASVDAIARGRAGQLVLSADYQLTAWDAGNGQGRAIATEGNVYESAWTQDGTSWVAETTDGVVITDAGGSVSEIPLVFSAGRLLAINDDGKRLFVADVATGTGQITAYDTATGRELWTRAVEGTSMHGLRVAANGDLGVHTFADGQQFHLVVLDGNGDVRASHAAVSINDFLPIDARWWLVSQGETLARWDTQTGALEELLIPDGKLAVSASRDRLVSTSAHELHVIDAGTLEDLAFAAMPEMEMRAGVFVTDQLIATLLEDGTVAMWRLHDGKLERAGRLIDIRRGGTVLVSPEGYYLAEADAVNAIGFTLGGEVFRFEQFDAALNRPHLALGKLGVAPASTLALYEAAFAKRSARRELAVTTATRFRTPSVELAGALPLRTADAEVSVALRADGKGAVLARVNVRVNGVPVLGRDGLDIAAQGLTTYELTQEVPLEIGVNRIDVEAENTQGVLAIGRSVLVTRTGTARAGTIHLIGIGVSKYAEGNDLRFAAKDAEEVTAALARVAGKGAKVETTLLRDGKATRKAILALRKQLEQTAEEDTVIMFVSGHGLLDDDDTYVFGTHDVSFDAPGDQGVRFDELEGLLDGIPARRRVLMLDTCHAGEVDADELAYIEQAQREGTKGVRRVMKKTATSKVDARARAGAARELFTELRRGAGVTVLAASAGAEYSYEDAKIANGLFSHAVMAGLDGAADGDDDGGVHLSELLDYLIAEVPRRSKGFQVPQARTFNWDLDFDLTPGRPHREPWSFDGCIGMPEPALTGYQCGALIAYAEAAPGPTADDDLDQLAATLAMQAGTFEVKWDALTGSDLTGLVARRFRVRAPDFGPDAHAGFVIVDPALHRRAICLASDAVPAAVERCRRVLPSLVAASPPDELK